MNYHFVSLRYYMRHGRLTQRAQYSETHPRVDPVGELQTSCEGGIRCRKGRAPLSNRIR